VMFLPRNAIATDSSNCVALFFWQNTRGFA